jgi:hypothetical protein
VSFISTGFRELSLKVRRQRTRMALKHEKRLLQKSEIALGREGTAEAANFPEVRNEIVALKKLEQEQREVALRIARIEEALKKIAAQRGENSRELTSALQKLEEEKRPLVERRNEAKVAADRCDNELATVDRRLQENETADREVLKKMSTLQATEPPPNDLEAQMQRLSSDRARLPREKAEMERARLGSVAACRAAREKLTAEEALVGEVDKRIAKVRADFDARDKSLGENAKAQEDEVNQARQQHQTVEEKKNPAYLNIGRHLASQGIAPPSAPHLLTAVQRRRSSVDRHTEHKAELAKISSEIDKQELRKFYFTIVSLLALFALILPLISQSPPKREWLPAETLAILALDLDQLNKGALANRWRKEQPDIYQKAVTGLLGAAARTPAVKLAADARRVTRAFAFNNRDQSQEYVLVEARGDLAPILSTVSKDTSFTRSTITGLPVWQRTDVTLARVGPRTLAVGSFDEVDQLVRVRLGIQADLKIDDSLLQSFQALDPQNGIRLVARNPKDLSTLLGPFLPDDFLALCDSLAFEMNLGAPAKAHLLVRATNDAKAKDLAAGLQNQASRWLSIPSSDFVLTIETPKIEQKGDKVEVYFDIPEGAGRLLLQRLAKLQPVS